MFLRASILIVTLASAHGAFAETLTGAEIEPALNDVTIWYEPLTPTSARQFFKKNGQTPYIDSDGDKTFGVWMVRGDTYCSQWPPSDRFVCYGVEREALADGSIRITFLSGGDGKRYAGIAKPGSHIEEPWGE